MPSVSTDGRHWQECNGQGANPIHFDDVEIQAALDSLPDTGGTIYLSRGTFTLSKQIARAIDHVSIIGEGKQTRINFDGATPVIATGSQDGWVLRDFDTDAGDISVVGATNYATSYWVEGVAAAGVPGFEGLHSTASQLNRLASPYCDEKSMPVLAQQMVFTENGGAHTYSAKATLPECVILDVILSVITAYTNGTSAVLNVGDATDPDGWWDNIDLLAASPGSLSALLSATGSGVYKGAPKLVDAGYELLAEVVTGAGTEHAGALGITVVYIAQGTWCESISPTIT